jgi:sensor histidine kinase regulating citrate/malate metabolism
LLPYALLSVDERGGIASCNRGGINLLEADSEEDLLNCKIQQFIPDGNIGNTNLSRKIFKSEDIHEIEIITLKQQKIPVEFIADTFLLPVAPFTCFSTGY